MATTKWVLDPTHSEVQFKVKHMMISTVTGQFMKFDATADTEEEDLTKAQLSGTDAAAYIPTNNRQRDAQKRAPESVDPAPLPHITFVATHQQHQCTYSSGKLC